MLRLKRAVAFPSRTDTSLPLLFAAPGRVSNHRFRSLIATDVGNPPSLVQPSTNVPSPRPRTAIRLSRSPTSSRHEIHVFRRVRVPDRDGVGGDSSPNVDLLLNAPFPLLNSTATLEVPFAVHEVP